VIQGLLLSFDLAQTRQVVHVDITNTPLSWLQSSLMKTSSDTSARHAPTSTRSKARWASDDRLPHERMHTFQVVIARHSPHASLPSCVVAVQISRSMKTAKKTQDDVLSTEAQMSNAPKTSGALSSACRRLHLPPRLLGDATCVSLWC